MMKQKIFGAILSFIFILSCTSIVAFAQSNNKNFDILPNMQIENLDSEYMIITETGIIKNARSTTQTRYLKKYITDKNNVEQCAYYLYGEFDINTRQCVNSYYDITTSGGQWRVENPTHSHDNYTVYGSYSFVRRILGIKIEERPNNVSFVY